ncbi:Peptidase family M23 [Natronorubrum sediminis]|uniref:Peptidase family M23 n=1 Tax=Natronorubrum sediminis TaxID=640943 RepID=A0A1H6G2M6_9EURY|nr:M23 family metallopeptidase [Natronorubrum sediminis]SEH16543.1 Peptidase family M23 [Natronorubrum sediminis]
MTEQATTETATPSARLRSAIRSFEPMYLVALSVLAIPGYLFDSLAVLQIFQLFFLFFLWPLVAPLVGLVLGRYADETDATEPTDWIHMGTGREYAIGYAMLVPTFLNPLVMAQDLQQLLGSAVALVRYRGSIPGPETDEQHGSYRLPVDGTWTVVNGSLEREYSHSWFPVNQRYAYDFVITDDDGHSATVEGPTAVENYYCYDEPVLAPADGTVVDASDDDPEAAHGGGLSHLLKRDIRGNYVVIQHAPDEYSSLVHLVPNSVAVEPGDYVERGQQIGRCGHSGNSSEPHLHFQVQDHPNFAVAASLPITFEGVETESPWLEGKAVDSTAADRTLEEGDETDDQSPTVVDGGPERVAITAGQRVSYVDACDDDSSSMPSSQHAARPTWSTGLERLGVGVSVGGVITFFVGIVASWSTVVALLAASVTIGGVYWLVGPLVRDEGVVPRPTRAGVPIGLAVTAATVWYAASSPFAAGRQTLGGALFLLGFGCLVIVAEYDRRRLQRAFDGLGAVSDTDSRRHES